MRLSYFELQHFLIIIFLLILTSTQAQKVTISGNIRDAESGESLIGASIYNVEKRFGSTSNIYGFYSLTLYADSVQLSYSYVGYQPKTIRLALNKDTVLVVRLQSLVLSEVVINADRTEQIQESAQMSTLNIPVNQIKKLPAFMGETDVIKVLQLLPGVQGGSEGSSGLYVRGGGPDQNLILLDGVPVYNASHLYGFFSTFNADAINHVELVKGGFPARYGGRLSSVLDIRMKEGNSRKFHGQASLGIIASKILLEGPIKKDKTSFIVSARRSYLNLLKASVFQESDAGVANNYYFYDFNAKINHKINDLNRLYLSLYLGEDKSASETESSYTSQDYSYTTKSNSKISWGNAIASINWNHVFNKKLFSNFTLTYTNYDFHVLNETMSAKNFHGTEAVENKFYRHQYKSGIYDYSVRMDFDFIPNRFHYLRFGVHAINHDFTPGVIALTSSEAIEQEDKVTKSIYTNELSAYLEDDWEVTSRLKFNIGVHASAFFVDDKSYPSLQPRFSGRFLVSSDLSLKASFATMQQNIHLLTNAGIGLPTDLWVPATGSIRPQTSRQAALGIAYNFKDQYEISAEGYYKTMNNVIEYKDGATYLNVDQDWQTKVEKGTGESYGMELLMQKKTGRVSGWVGYTLSWNYREFANLNEGIRFPYRYDRRHDAKIAITYEASEHFNFGLVWVYGTGNAVSVPLEMYQGQHGVESPDSSTPMIWHYNTRNGFRMRAYHRLDLSASYSIIEKWGDHRFTLSIYNAYARKNPYYLQFGYYKNQRALIQENLFSILPTFTYSIRF